MIDVKETYDSSTSPVPMCFDNYTVSADRITGNNTGGWDEEDTDATVSSIMDTVRKQKRAIKIENGEDSGELICCVVCNFF